MRLAPGSKMIQPERRIRVAGHDLVFTGRPLEVKL